MTFISIVGPAKNEAKVLPVFLEKASKGLLKTNSQGEIIIINDGSRDSTAQVLQQLQKKYSNLRVVTNLVSKGLTESFQIGIDNSKGDIIALFCTDMESNPEEDLPKLINPIIEQNYDFVIGWRQGEKSSIIKSMLSESFNNFASLLFKIKVHDSGWVRAFRKEIIQEIPRMRADWHRYMVFLAANTGFRVKEVKMNFYPRDIKKSNFGKIGFRRVPIAFFSLISLKLMQLFSKNPMLLFGIIGSSLLSLSFILGIYVLILNFFILGNVASRTPLILLTIMLFLSGIQFVMFGFLADLVISRKS